MTKQVTQAKEAIVAAAADTKRSVITVGVLALAALVIGGLALLIALGARKAANV